MRVANPEGSLRYAIYGTGISFVMMWVGLVAQKIYLCSYHACTVPNSVAISQLISEFVRDLLPSKSDVITRFADQRTSVQMQC